MLLTEIPVKLLITIIAIYRVFKLNKELAVKAMAELDKRSPSGYAKEIEELSNLLRSVGKGYVVKCNPELIVSVKEKLTELKIINEKISENTIYVGILNQEQINKIQEIVGIELKKDVEDVENSGISSFWKQFG